MKLYNIKKTPRVLIKNTMALWTTTLEAYSEAITQVTIKCGIYKRESLFSLLFQSSDIQLV